MRAKKYIAPILISAALCAYYIAAAITLSRVPDLSVLVKIAVIFVPAIICGVIIGVLVQRIREIRSGEEDDLDQY